MVMKRKHFATDKGMKYGFVLFVAVLLTPFLGWGQTDYSGVYYIASRDWNVNNTTTNFYLCPTENWAYYQSSSPYYYVYSEGCNTDTPFMTTYQCRNGEYNAENAVWIIEKHPTRNCYYFKRAIDGKYLTYNRAMGDSSNAGRMRVHLEASPVDTDNALFEINYSSSTGIYEIITIKESSRKYLNVTGPSGGNGNVNSLQGTNSRTDGPTGCPNVGGIIGLYTNGASDPNGKWYLEPKTISPPTINFNNETSEVTITADEGVIYCTTNGDTPTSSLAPHTSPYVFSQTTSCTIKAIAVKRWDVSVLEVSSDLSSLDLQQVATPTIQNNGNNAISITSATTGATIYYTTDGSTPTTSSNVYIGPLTENVSNVTIKAIAVMENMINSAVGSGSVTLQCATPVITRVGMTFTLFCSMPTDATLYYTLDGGTETEYSGPVSFASEQLPMTVTAVARHGDYTESEYTSVVLMNGTGTPDDPFLIYSTVDFSTFVDNVNNGTTASACYELGIDISASDVGAITADFSGTFDGGLYTISDLSHSLFNVVDGGTVRNVILKDVSISGSGNVGAICNEAQGNTRIYNCGILPSDPNFTTTSSVGSSNGYCGGLVGLLDGTSRVINCYSFANITGGTTVAGIVGYNNTSGATQSNYTQKTIVMNCMFYGEISGGTTKYPVYGGNVIANNGNAAINNYNYYRGEATFDDGYNNVANYNRSWPAEERNLRRFEYYRSILNSNRRLCTWWMNGEDNVVPTDDNVASVGIAKWVLDRSLAPYPVLKHWGKYPSVINRDPERVWDTIGNQWVQRSNAAPYQGKQLGTLSVTVNSGTHPGTLDGLSVTSQTLTLVVTDMDTLNYDFGYAKVQLPYYNELFGDPSSTNHLTRYYGNYTDKVVTGWKIIAVNNNDQGSGYTFDFNWESGCNFADRSDKYKDLFAKSGRVFAQGGYYYVPEGVTAITIEAYWGNALYLHGKGHSLDRVSVCSYEGETKNYGYAFTPAGTLPSTWAYNNMPIYDDLGSVRDALSTSSATVYDQAVVLVGNFQVQARNDISLDKTDGRRVTFMSADLDMDNEPDFCWQFQWRLNTDRLQILPVRFDFLPIPELGLAIRHNKYAYAIGIFVPRGHFEITETAFMHTTQFEYMKYQGTNHQQPLIFNGGQFEQIVSKGDRNTYPQVAHTRNIILGGNVWMKRFTPGSHTGDGHKCIARHCAVSIMGGDYPEFYLSGLYRKDITTNNAYDDNPHCYTNGGRFGLIAGAGNEAVKNSVYFEIDHSIINEFYGGGINANNPVAGSVNVVINNSLVNKYCGGPRIGTCQTVTTEATGTIFNHYFGGGNGGTNLYRDEIYDNNVSDMPSISSFSGTTYGWSGFAPISTQGETATYSADYGYHAEFEFEVFNQSNGINNEAVVRTYRHWAQFGTTSTRNVSNTLVDCTVKNNFYGGGNLGNVNGNVTTTLTNCNIIGNAYGGGFSASIPSFPVHDKNKVSFPKRDAAGVCHNGSVGYRTDDENNIIKYTWCYKNPETNVVLPSGVVIPSSVTTSKPAFQYEDKWYCYTTVSLEDLGAISGNTSITVAGNTSIQGHVFGAGDASKVQGDTFVHIKDSATVLGNVYGGGNMGEVEGHTKVVVNGQINSNGQGTGSSNNPTGD